MGRNGRCSTGCAYGTRHRYTVVDEETGNCVMVGCTQHVVNANHGQVTGRSPVVYVLDD